MSNDRHKFRVWDDTHKEYLPLCDCKLDARSGKIVKQSLFQENRYTIEQCIGLADKNGKLIFDGDVIQENGINRYIHWHDSGWCYSIRYDSKCHWPLRKEDVENAEIIGNIHDEQFRDATKMVEGDNND